MYFMSGLVESDNGLKQTNGTAINFPARCFAEAKKKYSNLKKKATN